MAFYTSPAIRRIALTGGIACGKSLAGAYLQGKGIPVIDADDVVHTLLRDDEDLKAQIRETFGDEVFDELGQILRPKLGQQVFADVPKRKLLESWIHPKTRAVIEGFYAENHAAPLGVSIIPLLFESGLADRYDEVWLLDTEESLQLERLIQNRGMGEQDALARIRNQMPAEEKRVRTRQCPDFHIIENAGTPEAMYRRIDGILAGR